MQLYRENGLAMSDNVFGLTDIDLGDDDNEELETIFADEHFREDASARQWSKEEYNRIKQRYHAFAYRSL